MRVDHTSIAWALNGGHAYYMGERLIAALPPRHGCSFADVCVIAPCGAKGEHYEVIVGWWRAEQMRDVASSWSDAVFLAQAARVAQEAWDRLVADLGVVRIGESKREIA